MSVASVFWVQVFWGASGCWLQVSVGCKWVLGTSECEVQVFWGASECRLHVSERFICVLVAIVFWFQVSGGFKSSLGAKNLGCKCV